MQDTNTDVEKDGKKGLLARAELPLNVTRFYEDEEQMKLMVCEEAIAGYDDDDIDIEYFPPVDRVYEMTCMGRLWRIPRASLLALSLLLALGVGVFALLVVLVCTFVSLSDEAPTTREDLLGVINWLHYPVGDLSLHRLNHSIIQHHVHHVHN